MFGGNPLDDGVADTYDNFYVLDENNNINQDGFVKMFKFYAKNTNPVQLVIQAILKWNSFPKLYNL